MNEILLTMSRQQYAKCFINTMKYMYGIYTSVNTSYTETKWPENREYQGTVPAQSIRLVYLYSKCSSQYAYT